MDNLSADDLSGEARKEIVEDCAAFQRDHAADIDNREAVAGQDFALTRNRHGAGFWDGDWPREVGKRLTDAAHFYGTLELYLGGDGKLYTSH